MKRFEVAFGRRKGDGGCSTKNLAQCVFALGDWGVGEGTRGVGLDIVKGAGVAKDVAARENGGVVDGHGATEGARVVDEFSRLTL